MMADQRERIYQAWAPPGGLWSPWVKAVLFAHLLNTAPASAFTAAPAGSSLPAPVLSPETFDLTGIGPPGARVLIADFPGPVAVTMGLQAAEVGFRPVPLFSALPANRPNMRTTEGPVQMALPQEALCAALDAGAGVLGAATLPPDAPPIFLLDSHRHAKGGGFLARLFDNRHEHWITDVPSGHFLMGHGLRGVVLLQRGHQRPARDVAQMIANWRNAGLTFYVKDILAPTPPMVSGGRSHTFFGFRGGVRGGGHGGHGGFG